MGLRNLWRKYGHWVVILIIMSIVAISTVWFLHFNPQYTLRFALAPLIALFLILLLASCRKCRVRLRELLIEYPKAQKRGGLFYRYGRVFNALMITVLLVFCLVLYYGLEFPFIQYIPFLVFAFFIAFLISGVIFIFGFLRVAGKWGLLLILIITVIVGLRILLWQLSR